jgi:hypothetical protein
MGVGGVVHVGVAFSSRVPDDELLCCRVSVELDMVLGKAMLYG